MAKKKRRTTLRFRLIHPREVGKFYRISDSNGGHPARVYLANPNENTYFIQRFSRKERKDRKILTHNIDPESKEEQYVVKKPEAVGYDELEYEAKYEIYRVHPDDEETVEKYQKFSLKKKKNR